MRDDRGGLQWRGKLIDSESILPYQDGMQNYSLIIEKGQASPGIHKHAPLSAAPSLSSMQD